MSVGSEISHSTIFKSFSGIDDDLGSTHFWHKQYDSYAKGVLSYYKTGLTSGKMEGINRKIRGLLASAFGFRDHDFLKLRLSP